MVPLVLWLALLKAVREVVTRYGGEGKGWREVEDALVEAEKL